MISITFKPSFAQRDKNLQTPQRPQTTGHLSRTQELLGQKPSLAYLQQLGSVSRQGGSVEVKTKTENHSHLFSHRKQIEKLTCSGRGWRLCCSGLDSRNSYRAEGKVILLKSHTFLVFNFSHCTGEFVKIQQFSVHVHFIAVPCLHRSFSFLFQLQND